MATPINPTASIEAEQDLAESCLTDAIVAARAGNHPGAQAAAAAAHEHQNRVATMERRLKQAKRRTT